MGNRYYLTGAQLGMLMRDTDESRRMKLLNDIMNDQNIESEAFKKCKRAMKELNKQGEKVEKAINFPIDFVF